VDRVHNSDRAALTRIATGTALRKPTVWHLHGSPTSTLRSSTTKTTEPLSFSSRTAWGNSLELKKNRISPVASRH